MDIFKSNGLRFYPVLADRQTPNPVRFADLPFALQSVDGVHQPQGNKGYQVVDFSDISYVQVWSDIVPDLEIYDKNDNSLANLAFTEVGEMDGVKVYQLEIDWASIANTGEGVYVIVENGTDYFRSEPIYQPIEGVIKLIYSNNNDSLDYGLYSFCGNMVAYFKARLKDYEIPVDKIVWEDNLGQNRVLRQEKRNLKRFETCKLPYYQQEQLAAIFSHDKVEIALKKGDFSVSDKYEVFADSKLQIVQPEPLYNAFESNVILALKDSFVRRIPKEKNTACLLNVTVNIIGNGLVRMTNNTDGSVNLGAGSFEVNKGDNITVRFGIDDLDTFTGNHQYSSELIKGWALPSRINTVSLNGSSVIFSAVSNHEGIVDIVGEITLNNIQAAQVVDIDFTPLSVRQEYDFANPLSYVDDGNGKATTIRDLRGYTPDLTQNVVSKRATIGVDYLESVENEAFYPMVSLPILAFKGDKGTAIFGIFKHENVSYTDGNHNECAIRFGSMYNYLAMSFFRQPSKYRSFGHLPQSMIINAWNQPPYSSFPECFLNKRVISVINKGNNGLVKHDSLTAQIDYETSSTYPIVNATIGDNFTMFSDGTDSLKHRFKGKIFYMVHTEGMTFEEQDSFQNHLKNQEL